MDKEYYVKWITKDELAATNAFLQSKDPWNTKWDIEFYNNSQIRVVVVKGFLSDLLLKELGFEKVDANGRPIINKENKQ